MDVEVASYWTPVALDADGTPLANGERMIEVEPGKWMAPLLVAAMEFLKDTA